MKKHNIIVYLDLGFSILSVAIIFTNYIIAKEFFELTTLTGISGITLRVVGVLLLLLSFVPGANNYSHLTYRKLERRGLSKYTRHVHYFKIITTITAVALFLATPIFLISTIILIIIAFPFIIREEKVMLEEFGDDYINYKKEVSMLIPFTNKLKIK